MTIAQTGGNTALATYIATYAPNDNTFYCLVTAIITGRGEDSVAQAAAWESYNTVTNQTLLAAGVPSTEARLDAGTVRVRYLLNQWWFEMHYTF